MNQRVNCLPLDGKKKNFYSAKVAKVYQYNIKYRLGYTQNLINKELDIRCISTYIPLPSTAKMLHKLMYELGNI